MTLITYLRRAVALADTDRFYLAPHIAARPDGDALKRFVCFLVLYARDVQTGQLPGEPPRYVPHRAERYAREALMPPAEFAALAHRSDRELATYLGVPLEQIACRRKDLGVDAAAQPRVRDRRAQRRRWCQPDRGRRDLTV